MKLPTLLLFMSLVSFGFSQAKIELDSNHFDFGNKFLGEKVVIDVPFRNVGDQPLVINRISTGDGGTMASYPKEPIPPGDSGVIKFHVHSSYARIIRRSLVIQSNTQGNHTIIVRMTGRIVYPVTTIAIDSLTKNIGVIPYNKIDSIQFQISNIGTDKLHIKFDKFHYSECDLVRLRHYSESKKHVSKNGIKVFDTNAVTTISAVFRNVYGNPGEFKRKLKFIYNSIDTLVLIVTGKYEGIPPQSRITEGTVTYVYYHDILGELLDYGYKDNLTRRNIYAQGECIRRLTSFSGTKHPTYEMIFKSGDFQQRIRYD
ncbi:MAG: DUF1573 domain-containing protein [Flavobacteriales bacterium]|nr:DUF1573 domain-containing protein [Flavobacteriales bacterium]